MRNRLVLCILLLVLTSSDLCHEPALAASSFLEQVQVMQTYVNEWFMDSTSGESSCSWRHVADSETGNAFYMLVITDSDGTYEIGSGFVPNDPATEVSGMLFFCDINDDLWHDNLYMEHVVNLISMCIYSTEAVDNFEDYSIERQKFVDCLDGYRSGKDLQAEQSLVGNSGMVEMHYRDNEKSLTIAFYFHSIK